ncbi:hypothetical protein LUZ61_004006 [Rhynchospora tenuis]|uniref:BED-type domain-containing protein n=1 Tax=Rhynchospora tenuis TaxID=198213 RepID=A0AAD6ETC6_9POAL|nr:hypothetical protein LUZ61_004006 [Rhynchospora tenuis]
MGMGIHGETMEDIQRIEETGDPTYVPVEEAPPATNAGEAAAADVVGETPAQKKTRKTTSDVWKHFTKRPTQPDGSYFGTCKYCGLKYLQGCQRGTSSMRIHIDKKCEKYPRNKPDLLQKILQAKTGETDALMPWVFDQLNSRKGLAIHIANAIYDKLCLWNLDKRVFSLVLDNASSNDACITELLYSTSMKDDLPVEGKVFHQRCGCHILNLIVQDGLSTVNKEIESIRDAMKWIKHSQARIEKFQLACSQANIAYKKPQWDVSTRWNSTYLMLELALELKPAFASKRSDVGSSSMTSDRKAGLKDYLKGKKGSTGQKTELEEYLDTDRDEGSLDDDFDILCWWKMKSPRFPILSKLVRDILAVPISIVASESTFSTSGRVLSQVRSSLSDESIEALLCAQDWLRVSIAETGKIIGAPLWTIEEEYTIGNEEGQ